MQITTYVQHDFVMPEELVGKQVVVIDTFRATTTMTAALANGAKRMIPVLHVSDALQHKADDAAVLLGGERHTKRIDGFDFGNSPLEYTKEAVEGRQVVMSTTNGTKAVTAAKQADTIFLGCFNNAGAVAEALLQTDKDIVLLCAGTVGKLSMEDLLTAGMIADAVVKSADAHVCDTTIVAREMYLLHQDDLNDVLKNTKHYNTMLQNDLWCDIQYCMQKNTVSVVPVFDGEGFVKL